VIEEEESRGGKAYMEGDDAPEARCWRGKRVEPEEKKLSNE
jgi:hypothetical protein